MKKILPINLEIYYSGMLRDRNRLVAIMSNKDMNSWYVENFIPLVMYPNGNIHCYDTTNYYEIFHIYDQVIDTKMLKQISIESLENELKEDRYVIVFCDQFYLNGSTYYHRSHKYSEILIYGFCEEEKIFYFHAGQVNRKDYDSGECDYTDFLDAVKDTYERTNELESKTWQITFGHPLSSFKIRQVIPRMNIRQIYYHFEYLLMGRQITVQKVSDVETFITGINIFDEMERRYSKLCIDNKNSFIHPIWCIKLLSEYILNYKNIMDALNAQLGLEFCDEIYSESSKVSDELLSVYALLQKYMITEKETNIKKAIQLIHNVKEQFYTIVNSICIILRNYLFDDAICINE